MSEKENPKKAQKKPITEPETLVLDQELQTFQVKLDQGMVPKHKKLMDLMNTSFCLHINFVQERQKARTPYPRKETIQQVKAELQKTMDAIEDIYGKIKAWCEENSVQFP